jgi:hypothetical protein
MLWILVIVTVLHVLPAMFWAGSTAVLARSGAAGVEDMAYPQLGAATTAILAGIVLWVLNHKGAEGTGENVLKAGAACAILAVLLQATALPRVRQLIAATDAGKLPLRKTIAVRQRMAAGLLALALAGMVVWRYF